MNKTVLWLLNSLKRSVWGPLSILMFLGIEKAAAQCNPRQDSLTLVVLYNATGGNQWKNTLENNQKWLVRGVPIDDWYGVTLRDGCVINVSLDRNNLHDSLPNLDLPNLEILKLDSNNLTGLIPNFNFPKLTSLILENNKLTGKIPYFKLPELVNLVLSNNYLSDTIPNFYLPKLVGLYLGNNRLSGQIPFFSLDSLKELYLYNNDFRSSTLPNFNLPNLRALSLFNCRLNTTIPNFNLRNLRLFSLANNDLKGCIPREIKTTCPLIGENGGDISTNPSLGTQSWASYWRNFSGACSAIGTNNCRYNDSIQLRDLYNETGGSNWVNRWNFNQPITSWYGIVKLNSEGCVTEIKLNSNNLRGVLPNLSFSKLQAISLQFNQLSGKLPDFNSPSLLKLELSSNKLDSLIPNFSGMPNLQELDLDDNSLTGSIPNFDKLKKLLFLDLTENGLTGRIPDFNNLPELQLLYLRNNKLSDAVPDFNLPQLTTLRLHSNELTGTLPELKALTKLTDIQMWKNKIIGCFPISYLRFCRTIIDPVNRKFDENTGLGLLNSKGDFEGFCNAAYDTLLRKLSIYAGDSVRLDNVRVVYPTINTTYVDTLVLPSPDCRIRLKMTNVFVKQRDTLSTTLKIAVTPNGDGINEQLDLQDFVDGSLHPNIAITIFNRWGQKVYAADPYNRDWAGQNTSGAPLLDGNYFFILYLKPSERILKGSVYLSR